MKKIHSVRAVSSVFFGNLLRTIAKEKASHIVLRSCSKEVWREVSMYVILTKDLHAIKHTS